MKNLKVFIKDIKYNRNDDLEMIESVTVVSEVRDLNNDEWSAKTEFKFTTEPLPLSYEDLEKKIVGIFNSDGVVNPSKLDGFEMQELDNFMALLYRESNSDLSMNMRFSRFSEIIDKLKGIKKYVK